MKKIFIAFAITSALLLSACNEEEHSAPRTTEKVAVVMRGGLTGITSNTRGIVSPQDPQNPGGTDDPRNKIKKGLPPQQLDVNIITVNYTTDDPSMISKQPDLAAWSGQTADVTRGFFGENTDYTTAHGNNPIIPAEERESNVPNSGRIEYTDEDAKGVQKVFYDENGEYYFVRIFYPYAPYDPEEEDEDKKKEFGTEFTTSTADLGASIIFHNVDGSQDILCSNLGWGNNYNPVIKTEITSENTYASSEDPSDDVEGEIVFSHMMSLFNFKIKPESKQVTGDEGGHAAQYGKIKNVQVVRQPNTLIADAMTAKIRDLNDDFETSYKANNFPTDGFLLSGTTSTTTVDGKEQEVFTPNVEDAGYIIVYPGLSEYRIEVETEKHKWVYGDLVFEKGKEPKPGKSYDITITMKEAYEMLIIETEVNHWWMDHVFD